MEDRLPKHARGAQQERDQQPTQAAVAVEERVDRLELDVDETGFDEQREVRPLLMQEQLKGAHAIENELRRRRNKSGGAGARAANPVLTRAELAWLFVAPAALGKKHLVDLADEPQRQREAAAPPIRPWFKAAT